METTLKRFTKAIGGKVSQNVVPAAVIGHAPLSSLPSDSKEPCSLTWVVPTFTALFQASRTPPFCFLWKKRKSCCLQLFPALWTEGLLQAHTHTVTYTVYNVGPLTSSFSPLFSSGCPCLCCKDDPRISGMKPKAFLLSFSKQRPCLCLKFTCAKSFPRRIFQQHGILRREMRVESKTKHVYYEQMSTCSLKHCHLLCFS